MSTPMRWTLAFVTLGVLALPSTAQAIDVECAGRLGSCSLSNEPADSFECSCEDGSSDGGGGTEDWIDLTERELLMVCEELVAEECSAAPATGGMTTGMGGDTGGGNTTGMDDGTAGPATTGAPSDDSGADASAAEDDGTPPPDDDDGAAVNTTGATSGGDTGGDDGEASGEDDSGCAIGSTDLRSGAFAFALLGLVGLARRRRNR